MILVLFVRSASIGRPDIGILLIPCKTIQAQREGLGAVSLDGKLVDIASIKQADAIVKKADTIAAKA